MDKPAESNHGFQSPDPRGDLWRCVRSLQEDQRQYTTEQEN